MTVDANKHFQKSLSQVKVIVLDALKDEDVRIILFGSAARGNAHRFSDIDIGILPKTKYNKTKLVLLKEKNRKLEYSIHGRPCRHLESFIRF